jgi:hypothetical protein
VSVEESIMLDYSFSPWPLDKNHSGRQKPTSLGVVPITDPNFGTISMSEISDYVVCEALEVSAGL